MRSRCNLQADVAFQSTPSAWRETSGDAARHQRLHFISIHSLRMEGDLVQHPSISDRCHFNPLPPHGGRPRLVIIPFNARFTFQSTPSAWRETNPGCENPQIVTISIHSLRMEGDHNIFIRIRHPVGISIHSLRMEGDPEISRNVCAGISFQSTPSAWRETFFAFHNYPVLSFQSTPSAWRETSGKLFTSPTYSDFNPLPPHGGRRRGWIFAPPGNLFQSTPSAWRETLIAISLHSPFIISIHSLRMEGDSFHNFRFRHKKISIHSLRMEGDA